MALTFTNKAATLVGAAAVVPTGGFAAHATTQLLNLELAEGAFLDQNWFVGPFDSQTSITGLVYQSIAGEPNLVSWPAGNWIIPILVHRRSFNIIWRRIRISRINATGTAIVPSGHNIVNSDLTGAPDYDGSSAVLGVRMDPVAQGGNENFMYSGNINQALPSVGLASDRIYITLEFFNNHTNRERRFAAANDEGTDPPGFGKVETPLFAGAADVEANLTLTPTLNFDALEPTASVPFVAELITANISFDALEPTATQAVQVTIPIANTINFEALEPTVTKEETVVLDRTAEITFGALIPEARTDQTATLTLTPTVNFEALEPEVVFDVNAHPDQAVIWFQALTPTAEHNQTVQLLLTPTINFEALVPDTTAPLASAIVNRADITFGALEPVASIEQTATLTITPTVNFDALEPEAFAGVAVFSVRDGDEWIAVGGVLPA